MNDLLLYFSSQGGGFMDNNVLCSVIAVDCVPNDPVDIRCGGPTMLGFDFAVKENETEEMIDYIIDCLKEHHVPLVNIFVSGKVNKPADKVWTKETIEKEIIKDSSYLKSENNMSYSYKYYRD